MLNRMKVSFLVIAAIVLFFSTSWIIGASLGEIVQAQEPSTIDTVHQEAVFNEVDYTAPATSDTVNEAIFNEVDSAAPATSDTVYQEAVLDEADIVLPAISEDTGSELTRWERSHLKTPTDSVEDAAPATSVKSGSELSMWERLNFLVLFSGN